ncbi:hypothetical protein IE53DRAFT_359888 [Violaceomyces palustris]|uniref:Uncharacterized protein n=1 Tax=Violaceomyces palustris TaxID=1673888 RepID=A0ACD0P6H2_9BASI|nr:hypothetical protein IE53DRAFT_359888 [Violaceomyces palustris]
MLDQQEARVQEPDSVLTASNNEDETPKHKFVVPTIKITRPMNGHKYSTPVPDQRYEKGVLFVPVKTEELGWDENGLYWNGTYAYPINDIYDDEGGVIGRRRNGPDGYRFVELYDGQTKPVRYATTNLDPQLAPARSVLQDGCESVSGSSPSLPDTEEGEEREIGMEEVSLASPPITMDAKASSEQKCGRMARPNLTLDTGIINARYNDLPSEDSDALDTGSSEGDSYSVAPSVWSRRSSSSLVHSESTTPETSSPHSELDKDEQASQGLEADLLTEKLSLLRDGQDPLAPSSEHRLTFESIGKLETQEDPCHATRHI